MSEQSDPLPPRPDPPRPPLPLALTQRLRELLWSVDRAQMLVGLAVVVGLGAVVWWAVRPAPTPAAPVELSLPTAAPLATVEPSAAPAEVVVHVAGAVDRPGLVSIEVGSRVADALTAAGGAAVDADLDRVNLAAPVSDGDRIWIPHLGDAAVPSVVSGPAADGDAPVMIDLNSATAGELEALPGVGPATAAAIVAERERVGGFGAVDDLLAVTGIGPAKLEQLRDGVLVGGRP